MPSKAPVGTLSAVLIIIILTVPTLASPVSAWLVRTDPLKTSLASLPDEPLGTAPLTLRREAYEALLPYSGLLPPGILDTILEDSAYFVDRARLTSAEPLENDLRLIKELARLCAAPGADPSAKDAAALATVLLLRAERHATLTALADGELVAGGTAGNAAQGKVLSAQSSAQRDYDRAMDLLRRGDAHHAVRLLASSLESSLKALSLMGVSYSPGWRGWSSSPRT